MKLESNTSEKNTAVRYLALAWVSDWCQELNLANKLNLGKHVLIVAAQQVLTKITKFVTKMDIKRLGLSV